MAAKYASVEAWVKSAVPAALRPVVNAVRAVMREAAAKAPETISYNMPMWIGSGDVAYMTAVKDVKLGFVRGIAFEDKHGLLKGRGKAARHLVFKSMEDVKPAVLRTYIRQAMKFDAAAKTKPKRAGGK